MKQLILLLICTLFYFNIFGQDDRSLSGWSIGTEKGYAQIIGEVRPASGFGFGIYGAKSLTHYLSVRLQMGMGDMRGLDQTTSTNWLNHPIWNGSIDPRINYNNAASNLIYANYKTSYQEASLQTVFTFTQLAFLKNSSPFDGFLLAGIGIMSYNTMVDAIDENDLIYDFAQIAETPASITAETIANLNTRADGNYETKNTTNAQLTPLYQLGAGLKWRVRNNIALSLTHRVSFTGKDDLDSYMWDQNNSLNGVNDIHHFSTIGVSYTFKKKTKKALPENPITPVTLSPEPELVLESKPEIEPISIPEPVQEVVSEPELELVEMTIEEKEVVKRAFENTEFETDKAIIRPISFQPLNELAALLSENPSWKLRITGHTDNMGTAEWNMDLSRRRAESVKAYLANQGLDVDRFIVEWYGEEKPIADNLTSIGRQRNRRVAYEIVE